MQYKLQITQELLYIVTIDGYDYLIDTGSPMSIKMGNSPDIITIDGIHYMMKNMQLNDSRINNMLNYQISGIIGTDILSKRGFSVNREEMTIGFDGTANGTKFESVAFKFITGAIVIQNDIRINGKEIGVVLDTGAHIGYVCSGVIDNLKPIAEYNDYNPILGELHGNLYLCNVKINNSDFNMNLAVMPDILQLALKTLNCGAVIGIPAECTKVIFDFSNKKIYFDF